MRRAPMEVWLILLALSLPAPAQAAPVRVADLGAAEAELAFAEIDQPFAGTPDDATPAAAGGTTGAVGGASPIDAALEVYEAYEAYQVEPVGYRTSAAWGSGAGGVGYAARVRGGGGYFQDALDSQATGNYGVDLAVPLAGQWSAFGGATYSHFSEGSQYFGAVGLFRQGADCGGLVDRLSGGVLFDQLVDTREDDFYVSQLRLFAGVALTDAVAAGVTYTDPTDSGAALFTLTGGPTALTFRPAEVVEAYVSARVGESLITATVGHRDDTSDAVAGLLVRRAVSSSVAGYLGFQSAGSSLWSGTLGLEWHFGPCQAPARRIAGTSRAGDLGGSDAIVRGQSGSAVGNPFGDPSLGGNLSYGPEQFVSRLGATGPGGGAVTTTGGVDETPEETPTEPTTPVDPTTLTPTVEIEPETIDPRVRRAL